MEGPSQVLTEAQRRACRKHYLHVTERVGEVFGRHVIAYGISKMGNLTTSVSRRAAICIFNGWKGVEPGWFELALVTHCGGRM